MDNPPVTLKQALDYEVKSMSFCMELVSLIIPGIISSYMAWKTKRKYDRYTNYHERAIEHHKRLKDRYPS